MSGLVWAYILPGLLLVVAGMTVAVVVAMRMQPGGGGRLGRLGRLVRANVNAGTRPALRKVTLQNLEPGDAIDFWDGEHALVESILDASEELHGRTTRWQWVLLDSGTLLEIGREGNRIFDQNSVVYQGSPEFDAFVAEPERGGLLKTFEARVREGRSAAEPVSYEFDGMTWIVRSTGTFAATTRGKPLEREVWADISSDPGQNVYFELDAAGGSQELLGIWTTHILLVGGRRLLESDITSLFGA